MKFELYIKIDRPQTDLFILPKKIDSKGQEQFLVFSGITTKTVNEEEVILLELESGPMMGLIGPGEGIRFLF